MTWYAGVVLFVSDVARSVDFYVAILGFAEGWSFDDNGVKFVAQVERDGCEIILSSQWPDKVGNGMMFISLDPADFASLRGNLTAARAPFRDGWWGYRSIIVTDPDGNELFFPDPSDPGGGRAQT